MTDTSERQRLAEARDHGVPWVAATDRRCTGNGSITPASSFFGLLTRVETG